MNILEFIAGWLGCAVLTYFVFRADFTGRFGNWLKSDRQQAIALSLLGGPVALVVALLSWIIGKRSSDGDDDIAKW